MGIVASERAVCIIQDPDEQLRERFPGICSVGNHCRGHRMDTNSHIHSEFSGHYPSRVVVELCDGGTVGEAGSDLGWLAQCDFWECGGIDCERWMAFDRIHAADNDDRLVLSP